MQYTVEIEDGSDELQELFDCVVESNRDNPQNQLTPQEYVNNIINGWLTSRVIDIFVHHARKQSVQTLSCKFGPAKNIKG